jgi:hypothetical protein
LVVLVGSQRQLIAGSSGKVVVMLLRETKKGPKQSGRLGIKGSNSGPICSPKWLVPPMLPNRYRLTAFQGQG